MSTVQSRRLPKETRIEWPYDEPPAFLNDRDGSVLLDQRADGALFWRCWEWGETRAGPDATPQEVIDAMLAALHEAERRMLDTAPFERLGKAVANVLPGALKAGE